MALVAGDRAGHGDSKNKAEQSRAHATNTTPGSAGLQNSHLRV
jgi:hypothetical protein